MKICIIGAGAIGGLIGTQLALAGMAQVSALARGATLAALQTQGWRLQSGGQLLQCPALVSDSPTALGEQDLIIIAVKGAALAQLAPTLAPLMHGNTLVMPAMNGVPWWFCEHLQATHPAFAAPLDSVDAGGIIAQHIPTHRVLGCVVHGSASTPEPGLVDHKMGKGLLIGEASSVYKDSQSPRSQAVVDMLAHAGFNAVHSANIRYDIWYKLWGNLTMNPVSAITGATTDAILTDPLLRQFCTTIMLEAAAIGKALGCDITQAPEDRHAVTAKLGAFKTSMLQDAIAGRALELDSIITVVHEIAQRLNMAAPNIDALLGLSRVFARSHGLT
jgi:2-dehydropantoate 2-reductase